jgi:predicted lipid-binding transport protein (Tim44 family)
MMLMPKKPVGQKAVSTNKPMVVGALITVILGAIPFIGALMGGIVAGYLARKTSAGDSAVMGIAIGVIGFVVWFIIAMFVPYAFSSGNACGSSAVGTLAYAKCNVMHTVQTAAFIIAITLLISAFSTAPIGAVIGGRLARQKTTTRT